MPSPEVRARQRRLVRPWRIALLLYTAALTLGTHWPNLQLAPSIPATDKTIHMLAFGGLTLLLWRTRWVRQIWLAGALALTWAAVDEISQNLPGLNRSASVHDMIANTLGVIVMMALLWAYQPVGVPGGPNRQRLKVHAFIIDEMFAQPRAWLMGAISAAAGAIPVAVAWLTGAGVETTRLAITLGVTLAALLAWVLWRKLWLATISRIAQQRPCIECGASPATSGAGDQAIQAETGQARCVRCGAAMDAAGVDVFSGPSLAVRMQLGLMPMLLAIAALAIGFAIILLLPVVYAWLLGQSPSGWGAPRIARTFGTLPPTLINVIDLAALVLLLALTVRVYRVSLARVYDQSIRCRRCGHDLRGTPLDERGIGRCGECGAAFVRSPLAIAPHRTQPTQRTQTQN